MSSQANSSTALSGEDYQGFSLRSVCWGYRDVFHESIEALFAEGLLGPQQQAVTTQFFDLLKLADQHGFDHVLRQFIGALHPQNRWIMQLPSIFGDLAELGASLGQSKLYFGTRYFQILSEGGFGSTPQQVRRCLTWMRRVRENEDAELAMAFLEGYSTLVQRLHEHEIELYVQQAVSVYRKNPSAGLKLARLELASSEAYLRYLSQECRLSDVQPVLRNLLQALTGRQVEIADLGKLDSDDLLDRGTRLLCLDKHLYLPLRFREFETSDLNRRWYILLGIIAAGMLADNSFPVLHGHPGYETCSELLGTRVLDNNLFMVVEYARVLCGIQRRWPGARRLLKWGLHLVFNTSRPLTPAEILLRDVMDPAVDNDAVQVVRHLVDSQVNCLDTAQQLKGEWGRLACGVYPGLSNIPMHPLPILSDFNFPVRVSSPPRDQLVADLKTQARQRQADQAQEHAAADDGDRSDGQQPPQDDDAAQNALPVCYVYDEWNHFENAYYSNYCMLRECCPDAQLGHCPVDDLAEHARRVRAVFERLKPDLVHREKYLADGDEIDVDQLVDYLIQRHQEPSPPVRFYQKALINRRDLAVLILLDVSGSTGSDLGQGKVIDIEKQAGVILGQGLAALGDNFSICGFTSNGREECSYFVYKDFDQAWGSESVARIWGAWPSHSTRIGPALRHSGYRLAQQPNRQRLIIVITDGKPMDRDYDPNTRYAQYDVRMACEENARQDIHTFAISTADNSQADMEIMFPRRRFAILSDIRDLPRVLPRLYVNLTT